MKKPIRFFLIGWAWIIFSILSFLDTAIELPAIMEKQDQISNLIYNPPPKLENVIELISTIFPYWKLIIGCKLVLAVAGIVAAINFLRLKYSAIRPLEIITWINVLAIWGAVLFFIQLNTALEKDGRQWESFESSIAVIVLFSVPFFLTGWQLRSDKIKALFKSEG